MRAGTKGVAGYYFHANLPSFFFALLVKQNDFCFWRPSRFSALGLAPLHRVFPYRWVSSEKTRQREGKTREKEYHRIESQRLTIGLMPVYTCSLFTLNRVNVRANRMNQVITDNARMNSTSTMLLFLIYAEIFQVQYIGTSKTHKLLWAFIRKMDIENISFY